MKQSTILKLSIRSHEATLHRIPSDITKGPERDPDVPGAGPGIVRRSEDFLIRGGKRDAGGML